MKNTEKKFRLAVRKEIKRIFEADTKDPFVPKYGTGEVVHDCPKHVQEMKSGKKGKVVNHSLNESGEVNFVDVDFGTGKIFENIPTKKLKVLESHVHEHVVKEEPITEATKPFDKRFVREWEKMVAIVQAKMEEYKKNPTIKKNNMLYGMANGGYNYMNSVKEIPAQWLKIDKMISEGKLTEAPMDTRFSKEFEGDCKALLSHIDHEIKEDKKKGNKNYRELSKLRNVIMAASDVPNRLARIVGMNESINESIGGVVTTKPFGSLLEGNSYYDLKQQYYEISDNHGHGGIVTTLQDIKKKADTDQFEKIGGIDRELRIWTDIHKLFNKSKLGKIL